MLSTYIVILIVHGTQSINWNHIRCATDVEQSLPDGYVSDIGRFPWLGVVQHNFKIGGEDKSVFTHAILIHPGYAVAPADDISKIPYEQILNTTKLILWQSNETQYAIDVMDYILHPEFEQEVTYATIALVRVKTYGETGIGDNPKPVLPVCLPLRGQVTFVDLFTVKMTSENGKLEKEAYSVNFVDMKECDEYYIENELTFEMRAPVSPTCTVSERPMKACIWESGQALITRQAWGHWQLLGFSVRGPGCGAPSRFMSLYDYLPWINDEVTAASSSDDEDTEVTRIGIRRLSPIKLIMYAADKKIAKEQGQCERGQRGSVVYKESFEILMSKNFAQGFFFVVVNDIAAFSCAIVNLQETTAKTNAAMWIEHYCHREIQGSPRGQEKPRDYRKTECFLYFKSAVFLQFNFYFSFKASIEATIYGFPENPRRIPNPFMTDETTENWWPTNKIMHDKDFYHFPIPPRFWLCYVMPSTCWKGYGP